MSSRDTTIAMVAKIANELGECPGVMVGDFLLCREFVLSGDVAKDADVRMEYRHGPLPTAVTKETIRAEGMCCFVHTHKCSANAAATFS